MNQLLVTNIVVMAIINLLFFFLYERTKPKAEEILQIVVIVTIASLGRVVFAVIPQVQPVTAMVIIAGYVYGCRRGYVTGALCALVSNMFLGQGPWTLFQMTGWGVVGLIAGAMGHAVKGKNAKEKNKVRASEVAEGREDRKFGENVATDVAIVKHSLPTSAKTDSPNQFLNASVPVAQIMYGVVAAYIFSFVTDLLSICYISEALSVQAVVAVFVAGFAFQTGHAIFNGIFILFFFNKLVSKLERARGELTK